MLCRVAMARHDNQQQEVADPMALKKSDLYFVSLLKNLSSLGIGLPTKIGRIEHWPLLRSRQHAWVLGAIASERYIVKRNDPARRNGSACSIALIVHAARRS